MLALYSLCGMRKGRQECRIERFLILRGQCHEVLETVQYVNKIQQYIRRNGMENDMEQMEESRSIQVGAFGLFTAGIIGQGPEVLNVLNLVAVPQGEGLTVGRQKFEPPQLSRQAP
jgi:hypothetical protein